MQHNKSDQQRARQQAINNMNDQQTAQFLNNQTNQQQVFTQFQQFNNQQGQQQQQQWQQQFQQQQQQQFQQQQQQQISLNNNNLPPLQAAKKKWNKQQQEPQPVYKQNNFDDDEQILTNQQKKIDSIEEEKQQTQDKDTMEQRVNFKLQSMMKAVKLSNNESVKVPTMISLSAQENIQALLENEDAQNEQRSNIDLICVIDRSGSMIGEKIRNVIETLKYILEFLNDGDRICLIQFNDQCQRILPLKKVSKANKDLIIQQINSLRHKGRTNIQLGLETAVKQIHERKYKNPVTSVFLLSDGNTINDKKCLKYTNSLKTESDPFSIHTFGFGSDHDPELMTSIAASKDGNFYYVQDIKNVDEMFVDALGGLFSVVGQNVKIDVKLTQKNQAFSDVSIAKTYGEMWKKNKNGFQISMVQFIQGVNKEFMMELMIPPNEYNLQDHQRNAILAEACLQFEYKFQGKTKILKKYTELELTFYNPNEQIPKEIEQIDQDVEFNYIRVIGAEAFELGKQKADQGKYQEAQNLISKVQKNIKKADEKNKIKLQNLYNDLEDNKQSCNQQSYKTEGRHKMLNNNRAHMWQLSKPQAQSFEQQQQQLQVMQMMQQNNQMVDLQNYQMQQQQQQYNNVQQQQMMLKTKKRKL